MSDLVRLISCTFILNFKCLSLVFWCWGILCICVIRVVCVLIIVSLFVSCVDM